MVQKQKFGKIKEMLLREKKCQRVNATGDIFQQRPKSTKTLHAGEGTGEGEEKRVSQGYV